MPSYAPRVLRLFFPCFHGAAWVSLRHPTGRLTEPVSGFESTALAAIQMKLRFSPNLSELASVTRLPLNAPIHGQHRQNEHAKQAAIVDELPHGLHRMQLRINESFHKSACSQCHSIGHYCKARASQS